MVGKVVIELMENPFSFIDFSISPWAIGVGVLVVVGYFVFKGMRKK